MPDEKDYFNIEQDTEDVMTEFLGGFKSKRLIAQIHVFILVILEASSDEEAGKLILLTLKWMRKFRRESLLLSDQRAIEEVDNLARKFHFECFVFRVPFYWPDPKGYNPGFKPNRISKSDKKTAKRMIAL